VNSVKFGHQMDDVLQFPILVKCSSLTADETCEKPK